MPTLKEWLAGTTADGTVLDAVKVARYRARHTHQPSTATADPPPSILIRGWNFTAAMTRWTLAGLPRRTQAEIDERLAICQACPFLQNNHCTKCGCACVEQNRLINKLALATEKCPVGKWQ